MLGIYLYGGGGCPEGTEVVGFMYVCFHINGHKVKRPSYPCCSTYCWGYGMYVCGSGKVLSQLKWVLHYTYML